MTPQETAEWIVREWRECRGSDRVLVVAIMEALKARKLAEWADATRVCKSIEAELAAEKAAHAEAMKRANANARELAGDRWRCFHCGKLFDEASAQEHFTDADDPQQTECIATKHPLVLRLRSNIRALEAALASERERNNRRDAWHGEERVFADRNVELSSRLDEADAAGRTLVEAIKLRLAAGHTGSRHAIEECALGADDDVCTCGHDALEAALAAAPARWRS